MGFEIVRLDHVQLAMPPGGEAEAEAFYSGLLGLTRVPKPEPLAARGGCWFERAAWRCTSESRRTSAPPARPTPRWWSVICRPSRRRCVPPGWRCGPNPERAPGQGAYADDPFGNRIELIGLD